MKVSIMHDYFCLSDPIRFLFPIDGDCVNDRDGLPIENGILLPVRVKAPENADISVSGTTATYENGVYTATVPVTGYRTVISALDRVSGAECTVAVYHMPDTVGKFRLSSDDNILFLKDLNDKRDVYTSIFDNPYLAVYKKAHDLYSAKVHLNLFYEFSETSKPDYSTPREYFNLSMMTDRYKEEFRANSDWLKLAFHSRAERPDRPYQFASPEEITRDCIDVCREIVRFAGAECISNSTTVHFGEANRPCVRALRSLGFRSLTGYFEHSKNGKPLVAYYAPDDLIDHVGERDFFYDRTEDMLFGRIDLVLNLKTYDWVMETLRDVVATPTRNGFVSIMIHEQYFYPDYTAHRPDFEARVLDACKYLHEHGYVGAHISDVTKEPDLNAFRAFHNERKD